MEVRIDVYLPWQARLMEKWMREYAAELEKPRVEAVANEAPLAPAAAPAEPIPTPTEAPAEKPKRGRPPKAQAEPAAAQPEAPPATVEEVREALQSVVDHDKLGMPVAEKIIKDVGGEKISTLTAAQRTEVVAACKAAVQGAK